MVVVMLSACQTNPAAKSEPGAYNYTPRFIWGGNYGNACFYLR